MDRIEELEAELEFVHMVMECKIASILDRLADMDARLHAAQGLPFDEESFSAQFQCDVQKQLDRIFSAIEKIDPERAAKIDRRERHSIQKSVIDLSTGKPR